MKPRRLVRVVETVAAQRSGSLVERLCAGAAQRLGGDIGLSLLAPGRVLQNVAATDGAGEAETLQRDLGEGPAFTAHEWGWPILVPDLALEATWPVFAPEALRLGVRAAFGFPLRSGAVRLGALSVYRTVPGALDDEEHADGLVVARLAHDLLLARQLGRGVDELDALFLESTQNSAQIHQAAGIVSVQLGIRVGAALALLRAHAYSGDRGLLEVAQEVVARRLRLDIDA